MSDWLERELSRDLGKVAAPDALAQRLGFSRPARREFHGAVLGVAAAVVMIVVAGYAASRSRALDLYRSPVRTVASSSFDVAVARPVSLVSWDAAGTSLRCDGGAGLSVPLRNANATELLAHHGGSIERAPASSDAGCRFCHRL